MTKQQRKRGRERDKGKERESSSCETVTSFSSLTHLHLTRLFGNILEIWILFLISFRNRKKNTLVYKILSDTYLKEPHKTRLMDWIGLIQNWICVE